MADVDELMSRCPLKHEIRVNFWSYFIKKLKRAPVSYLTLYSPPIMDVKYFRHCGYISNQDGVYSNVVGVTIDKEAFADSNSALDNRLELLLPGNINSLLNSRNKSTSAKQLADKFPFDVINLDYTDSLHKYSMNEELSPHFQAIETILKRQKAKNDFVLLITTRVELDRYNKGFLDHLKDIVNENIASTPGFIEKLQQVCNCKTAEEFIASNSNNFFVVSLIKFILHFLKDYSYSLKEAGVKWIIRDNIPPKRHLLHLAFYINAFVPEPAKARKKVGKRVNNVEQKSVNYIKASYPALIESNDYKALFQKHSAQINEFNQNTFELNVPEPKE